MFNTFLYRPSALKTTRSRLLGKVLRVEVKNFPTSLILVFNERQVDVPGEWAGDADCTVIACASVLSKLRDRQQLIALIRSGELKVQGDIQVVQNFVALAGLAEFNPAELLTLYTGDIAAEGISKAMRESAEFLRHGIKRRQRYVAKAAAEEWHMTPGPLEVIWFTEEAVAVEHAADALIRRLEKPEAK